MCKEYTSKDHYSIIIFFNKLKIFSCTKYSIVLIDIYYRITFNTLIATLIPDDRCKLKASIVMQCLYINKNYIRP